MSGTRRPRHARPSPDAAVEERVERLLAQMTLEEKVEQMHGAPASGMPEIWDTVPNQRLGIPPFRMVDGPRGVRAGTATAFPVAAARGATWDPELERRIGRAIGAEARVKGANVLLAPTINLVRHPRWGRAQESYGEDPFHVGELGAAFIEGAQEHVVASAKHLAANSIENSRFRVSVELDERTLREVYLPHFRRAVRAGVGSVMSAYNRVRGQPCAENAHLLRDILKGEWGFDGVVESDWIFGVHSTAPSALAGLDVEMPFPRHYGEPLVAAVRRGEVPEPVVDEAVRRILRIKLRFGIVDGRPALDPGLVECAEHRELALEAARRGIVLLQNQPVGGRPVLPLDRGVSGRIAVVGALADHANLGDTGSSDARPSTAVSPLAGLVAVHGNDAILALPTDDLSESELDAVAAAAVAVVVVGLTAKEEGEGQISGGDRTTLRLPGALETLVLAVARRNPRTVVVLEGGSAIDVEPFVDRVPALLMAWYPGMHGGTALAEILAGRVNPSGKLPVSFPRAESDLPPFDDVSDVASYGHLHGHRHLESTGAPPRFAFGAGLSYSRFELADLRVEPVLARPGDTLRLSVELTNLGPRDGAEVVQVYVSRPASRIPRAPKELRGFRRVELGRGRSQRLALEIPVDQLCHWDDAHGRWQLEAGVLTLHVGTSSADLPLSADVELEHRPS